MRVVFMGSPEFAVPVVRRLLDAGNQVVGVYTQPDRPEGRGLHQGMPPVKRFAQERDLAVFQPASLRSPGAQEELASLQPDVIVVAAYGKLLPLPVLALPGCGCLNIHPSLLPRHRGPSPVVTSILEGDTSTGVTVMLLDEGMDTGPVLARRPAEISAGDTATTLTRRLFDMGGELLVEVLPSWCRGELEAMSQDEAGATVTRKIQKSDGELAWQRPAVQLERCVRAFDPWPGAFTYWNGRLLKVAESTASSWSGEQEPGMVVPLTTQRGAVGVVSGVGVLELARLQLEGRRSLPASDFVRGHRDFMGSKLPS